MTTTALTVAVAAAALAAVLAAAAVAVHRRTPRTASSYDGATALVTGLARARRLRHGAAWAALAAIAAAAAAAVPATVTLTYPVTVTVAAPPAPDTGGGWLVDTTDGTVLLCTSPGCGALPVGGTITLTCAGRATRMTCTLPTGHRGTPPGSRPAPTAPPR